MPVSLRDRTRRLKNRKRKYGIDYNREIPFEKKVPIGA